MKKQVAVIGIGRFGRSVASALYNLGHDVLAIDRKEERVQDMLGKVTYPVSGDATNELTLKELGVPSYDAAIVAIGSDTVSSLMTSVLLRSLKDNMYIVARAQDELQRLKVDIEEFMRKHCLEDDEEKQKIEKQLLQEDKKNVKDK